MIGSGGSSLVLGACLDLLSQPLLTLALHYGPQPGRPFAFLLHLSYSLVIMSMEESISLEETNKIRISLGLKPLTDDSTPANDKEKEAEENYAKQREREAKEREAK